MHNEIVPAILTNEIDVLREQIESIKAVVDIVQIDYVDGFFAPGVQCCDAKQVQELDLDIDFEVHLMVEEPIEQIARWAEAGATRIIGHIEEMTDQREFIEAVNDLDLEVGLALKVSTPLSELTSTFVRSVDVLLLMAHEVGVQNVGFNEEVLEKIHMLHVRFPEVPIMVDGGMDEVSIPKVLEAGATYCAVGSAIFAAEDPVQSYKSLQDLVL